MKKSILALMMALVLMMMPVLSMAETAFQTYTHTNDQYTVQYPANWILLNAENITSIMEMMDTSEDEQLAQMISAYGPQVQQLDMVMIINETGLTNVNLVCQEVGMNLNGEQLMSMAPALVSQLSNSMAGIQFVDEGSLIDVNGTESLKMAYVMEVAGAQMCGVQVYIPGSTAIYIVTYTCNNADELEATREDFNAMLGTLVVK